MKTWLYIALAGLLIGTAAKFLGTIIGLPFAAKAEESAMCKLMACLCIAVQFIGAAMQFICGWALPILLILSLFN